MGILEGKRGLIVGVANEHSYGTHIATSIKREGGECLFTHLPGEKMARRCSKAIEKVGIADPWLEPLDASNDDDLDRVFDKLGKDFGSIDFLVHSIAFADRDWLKPGKFAATPREVFNQALDISAYTYMAMGNRAAQIMPNGGGMVSMSYYGAEKAIPGYNVMGVAKSALESATRYLAADLGEKDVRVNCISGGPLRTLSAMAVGGFADILDWVQKKSPLKRNVTGGNVGDTAAFLLSPLASGVTGEVIHVDCGYSTIGL